MSKSCYQKVLRRVKQQDLSKQELETLIALVVNDSYEFQKLCKVNTTIEGECSSVQGFIRIVKRGVTEDDVK